MIRITRLPLDDRNIEALRGEEWPEYQLNVFCAKPGCEEVHLQRHHIWRKSFVGGDVWWVRVQGQAIGNCIGLCNKHHEQITTNFAKIEMNEYATEFFWSDEINARCKLQWQPPYLVHDVVIEPHEHLSNECPTCHRALPKPKIESKEEAPRIRRTWSITVPKDNLEDGAETLDTLLEEIREEMGRRGLSYGAEAKYFVLSTAMALFLTHIEEIASA